MLVKHFSLRCILMGSEDPDILYVAPSAKRYLRELDVFWQRIVYCNSEADAIYAAVSSKGLHSALVAQ